MKATNTPRLDVDEIYTEAAETVAAMYASSTLTPSPTVTSTPLPTLTPAPQISSTPETLYGYPTPPSFMPSPTCPPHGGCLDEDCEIQRQALNFNELYLGKYVLRSWCNADRRIFEPCAVTISSRDVEQVKLWGYPVRFGKETGADLTGNGTPNIVVIDWPGGNCCEGLTVYEAGDTLVKIMDVGVFRTGDFIDFDEDGTYEHLGYVRTSSCTVCGFITLPIVYEYQDGLGYVPATDKYIDRIEHGLEESKDILIEFKEENPDDQCQFGYEPSGGHNLCPVSSLYRLVAYYILSGQEGKAREALNEYGVPELTSEYIIRFHNDLDDMMSP